MNVCCLLRVDIKSDVSSNGNPLDILQHFGPWRGDKFIPGEDSSNDGENWKNENSNIKKFREPIQVEIYRKENS
ncbi:unnamed protein product [Allacma fusca]|uniref:Uncharacterized protein n=1 Tax=Allacma fusca TaxID=39272 RepID=A0A8J2K429_9HEXA|nr:unnamed protein product [Allacma fusca]